MKTIILLAGLVCLAACAANEPKERDDPIGDFIAVGQLPEADSIHVTTQPATEVINDWYVIVTVRRQIYLLEYAHRCVEEPFHQMVSPDVRRDPRRIYAGADSYRGCRIRSLYELTESQATEVRQIANAQLN